MPRFFIDNSDVTESAVTVRGNDARHIARSLRMAVGDEITVSDSSGYEYLCRLSKIRDEECLAGIIKKEVSLTEPKCRITLFMAYPKSDKLELVVQKAVELGAAAVVPFESERCIKRPKADKQKEKTERLSRIAEEAAKQCGRGIIPTVSLPISYGELLASAKDFDLALFCYEGEGTESVKAVLEKRDAAPEKIAVVVGCEGGFSKEEAKMAAEAGFIMTGLGRRILRCETAPDFILSAISYRFEL